MRHPPEHVRGEALIFVPQDIADAGHLRPWNFWMPGFQVVAHMTAGLGDNFKASFHQPTLAPVGLKSIECDACRFGADVLDCLDDIGEPQDDRHHQNTRNARASIRRRKAGCRLARVMMSALHPRILTANSFTSISWKRPSLPLS